MMHTHKIPFLLLTLFGLCAACTYTLKIKDGRTAYDRKQFAVAVPMLEKEFARAKTRKEKGELAYELGDSYRRTGRDEKSLQWFQTAYDNNYGADALKAQAYTLKKLERYPEAREVFKNLGIEIGSPYEYRKEITACTISEGWLKEVKMNGMTVENAPFNSSQNDFAPTWYTDGRLIFTSDRNNNIKDNRYNWTGNSFMHLFMVDPESASPQAYNENIAPQAGSNQGTAAFNRDYSEVFYTQTTAAYKGDDAFCKIYVTKKTAEGWLPPAPLPFQKERLNYLHPALTSDGNTLYFACNDPEGWGGYDLYSVQHSTKTESGWDDPKLLSRSINTPGNELFPALDADTLYFASDGLPGMGGLDIFRTYKSDRNAWAPPLNLKAPINSGADDFTLIVDAHKAKTTAVKTGNPEVKPGPGDIIRTGFLTSNRPGGVGSDDIYRFVQRVPPPQPVKVDTVVTKKKDAKIILEGYVLEKILSNSIDPNSKVLGRKPLAGATVVAENSSKKQPFTVKEDGFFKMELAENTDYSFVATQKGYLSNSAKFSTKGIARDPANPVQIFEIEIVLDKIFQNQEIVLENIYYDYDKWDIRPDAEPTLNRLAEVLRQNPAIKIQLGSHTDCRGNDNYNQGLSQRRAESAVNYLISKGIDGGRLSAVGYGEQQPAVTCICAKCTETEHQTNRRTTFKVVD